MFWLVAIFSALITLVALYGVVLIARGLLGESVRLRRKKGGPAPKRSHRTWALMWLGLLLLAADIAFSVGAIRTFNVIFGYQTLDATVLAICMGIGLAGLVWLVRSIIGDRSRGRRRCPKCWHSLEGTPGLRCPECGVEAKAEKALFRSRRSRLAIALAFLLSLAAPLGMMGQAYLSQHEVTDLLPRWVLHRGIHLSRGSRLHDQAGRILYERIQYGGMSQPDSERLRAKVLHEMFSDPDSCWDHAHWMALMACVDRTSYKLTLDEWAGLHSQFNAQAWQRLTDPDRAARDQYDKAWAIGSHVLGSQSIHLRFDHGNVSEFIDTCDAFTQELIDHAAPGRNPIIVDNLTNGGQLNVLRTLALFAGPTAAPYADEIFALFDESSERGPGGSAMAMPAALALRQALSEDPALMQQFWTYFDTSNASDVAFVARMLSWPKSYSGDLRRWEFPGWRDWLIQQLESGPVEAGQAVEHALLCRSDMLPLVLDIAIPRMRAHPDQARFLIPDTAGLDEQERSIWCDRLMWLAGEGTPEAKFSLGWVLVRIGRENPALRDKADAMVRAMGLEPPANYEGPEGVNYLYKFKEPTEQNP